MRPIILVPGLFLFVGVGLAVGLVIGSRADDPAPPPDEIVVQDAAGETHVYSATEAAARIETLEAILRRSGERRASRVAAESETTSAGGEPGAEREADPLLRPDGKPYTPDELLLLARTNEDPELRAAAIRAMRWVDTDKARETLQEILSSEDTPPDLRLLTARMLARPPHRDHLPEELMAALAEETDPEVRRALVSGIASLRDRGAWMKEIADLLHDEQDADARAMLFRSVARTRWDPAARAEMLAIATSALADPAERRTALAALARTTADAEMLAAVRPLLTDPDPAIRAQAMRLLAGPRNMPLATLTAGLADEDAGVRAVALDRGLRNFGRLMRNKKLPKEELQAARERVYQLATGDPDAGVRRAAVSGSRNLPKKDYRAVVAAGRDDPDLFVRLTAYAHSPRDVARGATPQFLGGLAADEPAVRDYAYRQLRRLHGVRVPYSARWNANARQAAEAEIRRELAGR